MHFKYKFLMKKTPYKYESASLILQKQEYGSYPLVLGDAQAPLSKQVISKHSIQVIISIGLETSPKTKFPNLKYHLIKLRDQKDQPINQYFEEVTKIIEESRKNGAVLIHCFHGVSRSASFVIAYMMRKTGLSFEEAKQFVKKRRSCISPNEGFQKQLAIFQQNLKPFEKEGDESKPPLKKKGMNWKEKST